MEPQFFPWIFLLIFIPIVLVRFFLWVKQTGWRTLSKKFPLSKLAIDNVNLKQKYGRANIGGIYRRNSVFSAITEDGVFIRKPFPFSVIMPEIYIPSNEIDFIKIISRIDGEPNTTISKTISKLSSYKYADIRLKSLKKHTVIIPWNEEYRKNVLSIKIIEGESAQD